MVILPPGTLLQLMYLKKRISKLSPGNFIEIGPGAGEITQLLLDHKWSGRAYELDEETVVKLKQRFSNEINEKRLAIINHDYLHSIPSHEGVNLIISSMVIEHLDDNKESDFMKLSRAWLNNGIMIGLVPSSMKHWGIEDEIAGHHRRYSRSSLINLTESNNFKITHLAGLTFPISNFLLPLSNFLVKRGEHSNLKLTPLNRTKLSGKRHLMFKTHFPFIFGFLFNKLMLYPIYLLQNLFVNSENALVLYFEAATHPDNKKNEPI